MIKRRRRTIRAVRPKRAIRTVRKKRKTVQRRRTNKKRRMVIHRKLTSRRRRPRHRGAKKSIISRISGAPSTPSTPIASLSLDSPMGQQLLSQNQQSLSVIISVHNEESTIRQMLEQTMQLRPKEIIVVENGSTDRSLEICREYPVRCVSYPSRLGHDVGRAIGAREATGDVLLFLDGDLLLEASLLLPFVKSCYDGADVALNDLNPFYENVTVIDYVSMSKYYLNCLESRPDLGFCSLTAIPNAMTKHAALAIGIENLAVPPKAQAIAMHLGLRVERSATVDVLFTNKLRSYHNEIGEMILGDHAEAIQWLQEHTSARIKFPDTSRTRSYSDMTMRIG